MKRTDVVTAYRYVSNHANSNDLEYISRSYTYGKPKRNICKVVQQLTRFQMTY